MTWCNTCALKELVGWAGWVGTVAVGRAQFQGLNILFNTSATPNLKNIKVVLLFSKFFQTLPGGRSFQKGQLSFWIEVQIPNRI
jgi:hypothetical protein